MFQASGTQAAAPPSGHLGILVTAGWVIAFLLGLGEGGAAHWGFLSQPASSAVEMETWGTWLHLAAKEAGKCSAAIAEDEGAMTCAHQPAVSAGGCLGV